VRLFAAHLARGSGAAGLRPHVSGPRPALPGKAYLTGARAGRS